MTKNRDFGITDNSKLRRNPDMVFSEVDGEVVMLSVKNGEYYNLNEVSSDIWQELKEARLYKDLIKSLQDSYEVSYQVCKTETKSFLEHSIKKGIIEIIKE